jgi:hypothetical protein
MTLAEMIARMREMEGKATGPEWEVNSEPKYSVNAHAKHVAMVSCYKSKEGDEQENIANARLIAFTRNHITPLLDALERMMKLAMEYRDEPCHRSADSTEWMCDCPVCAAIRREATCYHGQTGGEESAEDLAADLDHEPDNPNCQCDQCAPDRGDMTVWGKDES